MAGREMNGVGIPPVRREVINNQLAVWLHIVRNLEDYVTFLDRTAVSYHSRMGHVSIRNHLQLHNERQ